MNEWINVFHLIDWQQKFPVNAIRLVDHLYLSGILTTAEEEAVKLPHLQDKEQNFIWLIGGLTIISIIDSLFRWKEKPIKADILKFHFRVKLIVQNTRYPISEFVFGKLPK